MHEIPTSRTGNNICNYHPYQKSLLSIKRISVTLAPFILRMPISLVRLLTRKLTIPNKPITEINREIAENKMINLLASSSLV